MSMHATVHLPMDGCGTWPPDPLPRACPPYPPCPPPYLRRDPVDHCKLLVLGHAPACDHAVVKEENICMLYRGTISIGYIIICSLNICLMILYVILSSFAGYLPGACFLSCACMAEHPRCCHVMRGASGPRPTLGFGKGGGGVGGGPSEQLRSDAMQQRTMSGKGVGGVTDSRRIRFRNYVRVRKVAQSPTPLETLRTHRIVSHCSKSLAARASPVSELSPRVGGPTAVITRPLLLMRHRTRGIEVMPLMRNIAIFAAANEDHSSSPPSRPQAPISCGSTFWTHVQICSCRSKSKSFDIMG